jgi:hypothetical protein
MVLKNNLLKYIRYWNLMYGHSPLAVSEDTLLFFVRPRRTALCGAIAEIK